MTVSKTRSIIFRVSQREYEVIHTYAKKTNDSVSGVVRTAVLRAISGPRTLEDRIGVLEVKVEDLRRFSDGR